jgi:hypothetical protein
MQAAVDRVMKTYGMIVNLTVMKREWHERGSLAIFLTDLESTKTPLRLKICDIFETLYL